VFILSVRYLLIKCRLPLHVCHSPPGYEFGYPEYRTEEAKDRRRGLLKEVCSEKRAIFVTDGPWSVFTFQNTNTSELNVFLFLFTNTSELNVFLFLFFPSSSACYWDPEVTFRDYGALFLMCTVRGDDYTSFNNRGDFVGHA
jgi:hypothetical protein